MTKSVELAANGLETFAGFPVGSGGACGTAEQEHGDNGSGEDVEGHAERGPPYGDAGILNDEVVEEVVDSVAGESGGGDPLGRLKADNCQNDEG